MKKQLYFLSFVEEGIFNPKYEDWAGGRIEVYIDTEHHNIEEIRFFCKRNKAWNNFRDEYDFKDVTKDELDDVRKLVKKKYYKVPKD